MLDEEDTIIVDVWCIYQTGLQTRLGQGLHIVFEKTGQEETCHTMWRLECGSQRNRYRYGREILNAKTISLSLNDVWFYTLPKH